MPRKWLAAFGASATGARLERMQRSPHYARGTFHNPVSTQSVQPSGFWSTMAMWMLGREQRVPKHPLPFLTVTRDDVLAPPASGLRARWLGHASTLLDLDGQRILIDPVWATRCSPFKHVGPKRFHPPPLPLDQLPSLDAVLISHDHYDHLDMDVVRALAPTGVRFITALGVGAHLEAWGVAGDRITELDWGESTVLGNSRLTALPARHFSGRYVDDRNATLWASWAIVGPTHRVFYSGDSGYFDGFRAIGAAYGPFDMTLIAIGAYGPTWPDIHITPEEAIAVHQDVGGRLLVPVHWGTFNLAIHSWTEPGERLLTAARQANIHLALPRPGESVDVASPPTQVWWRTVRSHHPATLTQQTTHA